MKKLFLTILIFVFLVIAPQYVQASIKQPTIGQMREINAIGNCVESLIQQSENDNLPSDVIKFAYKKGYQTPKRIWYLSNTNIKNTIYTDIFYTHKKDSKQYRYILYNKKRIRFATKSEQLKYIENRYF